MLFPAQKADIKALPQGRSDPKTPKSYILYCFITLSVILLTIAFAATELFAVFFSDVQPNRMLLSRLFGADAESGMSFQELMLNQSFCDLSFGKGEETETLAPNTEEEPTDTENGATTSAPSEETTLPEETTNAPSTKEPDSVTSVPEDTSDIYAPSGQTPPMGMGAILPMDLSLSGYGIDYIYNTSTKSPDMAALGAYKVSTDLSGIYPSGAPLVLIVHTHGTEGYSDEGAFWYDPEKEIARTKDKNKNVVRIGQIIAGILNENGISTVHCDVMHDEESYSGSYDKSAQTIKKYLAKYPTVRYVIDVHRDAVVKSSGELIRPVTKTEKGATAQVMAVVGTGESLGGCPKYMSNLAIAQLLREKLNSVADNLSRPTCLRPSAYNQQYSVYSILLEIGAAGNTLSEAENAATYVGTALSEIIKGK